MDTKVCISIKVKFSLRGNTGLWSAEFSKLSTVKLHCTKNIVDSILTVEPNTT